MNNVVSDHAVHASGSGMKKLFVFLAIVAILGVGIFVFDAPLISSIIALMVFMLNS